MNSRLARRMAMYVILASTFITIFTSSLQIYSEFQREVEDVNETFQQIERTHLQNITSRVWVLDLDELKRTLNNLLSLSSIQYIAVYEAENILITVGDDIDKNTIAKNYSLIYRLNNKNEKIGRLVVKASLDNVYQHIIDRAVIIIASNTVKTFIVSLIILFIFFRLVARHLTSISEFLEKYNFLSEYKSLNLDRKAGKHDELDAVVESINDMHLRLNKQVAELDQQRQHLSLTLNSIGDAVITTDVNGNITQMNPIAEMLTGWTNDEANGLSIKKVFTIEESSDSQSISSLLHCVLEKGDTIYLSNNTTLISKDGKEYHIADSAAPIRNGDNILGMVLVFNDVTEQYYLRELVAKNKRDLQAIMDNYPAVVYVKDTEGRFLFINDQFENLYHIKRKDVIGKNSHELFAKDIADDMQINDKAVLQEGHTLKLEEVTYQDDSSYTYACIKFPLRDEDSNIYAVCGISTDITERKQQEEQLRRSQKMEALGKLTGGIAHDYNNMLGVVLGYTELLELELADNKPELMEFINEITHAGERGVKLTKKLLSFSRQQASDAEALDLNAMLRDEQHMLEKTLTVRIKLILDLVENIWLVNLDAGELEDAIVNMSINAMHAIEGSGQLTIQTRNETLNEASATILQIEPGDYVLLNIIDTGTGMDERTKEKMFEPFYSTKGDSGTGLGLSQVYGFVERSHGAIKVFSEEGIGSWLTLYFPRHLDDKDEKNNENIEQVKVGMQIDLEGTETILVVDDEAGLRNLTSKILRQQGYNVFCADNGKNALELLKKEKIDLLFTDIVMPEMDGYQLADIVQKKYPSIKIQLASGFSDGLHDVRDRDDILYKKLLNKPYNAENLLKIIRESLG